jgi:hypothetical protein
LLRAGSDHGDADGEDSDQQIVFEDFLGKNNSLFSFGGGRSGYQIAPGIEIGPLHHSRQGGGDVDEDDILEITL